MVGADLANLVNEAALLAAKRGHDAVHQADFADAIEKIVLGTARKIMMSDDDRERTAYHEAGHALVGMLTPGADPVRKVSIIPRGQALGVTLSTPDADRYNYSREELIARIKVALGGRAAEQVVYGDVTTGAESDIRQLTMIARSMVTRWGMSDAVGPVFLDSENPYVPEQHLEAVDAEVRRIVEAAEEETVALLRENRSKLDALVARLLEKETVDQDEVYEVVGSADGPAEPEPDPEPTAAPEARASPRRASRSGTAAQMSTPRARSPRRAACRARRSGSMTGRSARTTRAPGRSRRTSRRC